MTYRGHVRNGVIVLDEPVGLEEGAEVVVETVAREEAPSLADRFRKVIGTVPDLPNDMAANHDHYLHGTQKR